MKYFIILLIVSSTIITEAKKCDNTVQEQCAGSKGYINDDCLIACGDNPQSLVINKLECKSIQEQCGSNLDGATLNPSTCAVTCGKHIFHDLRADQIKAIEEYEVNIIKAHGDVQAMLEWEKGKALALQYGVIALGITAAITSGIIAFKVAPAIAAYISPKPFSHKILDGIIEISGKIGSIGLKGTTL